MNIFERFRKIKDKIQHEDNFQNEITKENNLNFEPEIDFENSNQKNSEQNFEKAAQEKKEIEQQEEDPKVEKDKKEIFSYLNHCKELIYENKSQETARTYYNFFADVIEKTNQRHSLDVEGTLKTDLIIDYAKNNLKNRNEVSKLKNALRAIGYDFGDTIKELTKIQEKKPKKRRKKHKQFELNTTMRRINNLKNKKMKLAFRFAFISGARASELEKLDTNNITLKNGRISVRFKNSKGNKTRLLTTFDDKFVFDELKEYLSTLKKGDRLFYSSNYMQKVACKNKFHIHQLRRAYAQVCYYKYGASVEHLQNLLGHSHKTTTYKKYINYPCNLTGTKWDIN